MPPDTSAVSLAYQRWLKENIVRLGEIKLFIVEGGNANAGGDGNDGNQPCRRRTVLSTASSPPGSLIARVPDSAVLTVSSSSAAASLESSGLGNRAGREEEEGEEEGGKTSTSSPWREAVGLALALLVESRLGAASRFAPYVRWLLWEGEEQQRESHPVTWDPRAGAALFAGTAVARRLLVLPFSSSSPGGGGLHAPSAAPLAWSRLARPWLSRNGMFKMNSPSSSSSSSSSSSPPLKAEFLKCLAVVSSYAFVLGDAHILALVPVFDALDHAPGPPRVKLSHHSCGAAENDDEADDGDVDGFLEMRSTVPLARGEEVFNSYGRLGTSALARRYGFTVSDREKMLRSGDERLEVSAAEVGVAAAAAVSSSVSPPLRAPAACLRAAAASRGRALSVAVPSGEPSLGLLLAVRAALSRGGVKQRKESARRRREEEKDQGEEQDSLLEGQTLLEVARRRRAALEAAGRAELEKGGRGRRKDDIVFPPPSGFRLAEAVRRSELEGCDCLEAWVKRRVL